MLNHDKSQFEITCYTSSHFRDDVTADFQRAADRWREVVDLSDEEVTVLVQDDQIDILVEMSGDSAGHRARRVRTQAGSGAGDLRIDRDGPADDRLRLCR